MNSANKARHSRYLWACQGYFHCNSTILYYSLFWKTFRRLFLFLVAGMSRGFLASLCSFGCACRKTCSNLAFGRLLHSLFGFSSMGCLGFTEICLSALLGNICRLFWALICLENQLCLNLFLNCRMECLFRLCLWLTLLVPYLCRLWRCVSFVLKDFVGEDCKYFDRSFRRLVLKFVFGSGIFCLLWLEI